MEKIIFTKPTKEQCEMAAVYDKEYVPVYNNGTINHYRLQDKPKKKGCGCK